MNVSTISISVLVVSLLIGGTIMFSIGGNTSYENPSTENNVSMVDGKQIITINAKGGYAPRVTHAQAGVPTVIKIKTDGTFDCSSALTIPKLGIRTNLPPTGERSLDVPSQKAGTKLQGLCAMGMYNFAINFN